MKELLLSDWKIYSWAVKYLRLVHLR